MNEAQRQLERAATQAKAKGLIIVGYRPVVGQPKHADGSLMLAIDTMKPKLFDRMLAAAQSPFVRDPGAVLAQIEAAPAITKQGSLL